MLRSMVKKVAIVAMMAVGKRLVTRLVAKAAKPKAPPAGK
jgi:hypothetical protein